MSKNDPLSDFINKMITSQDYLKINQLKNGFSYKIWARHAYVGVWEESRFGFVIGRFKASSVQQLSFEYHWDFDEQFGTVKPIEEIEECPIKNFNTDVEDEDLMQYLCALEKENPLVEGYDTFEFRKQSAIKFGERLAGKGEYAKRLHRVRVWKR
jgi:hypothetical protein